MRARAWVPQIFPRAESAVKSAAWGQRLAPERSMRTLALSRLKQGFDSTRERHQINGLVGVCDAALWQWTTRWTSPSGIFTPKSVELI